VLAKELPADSLVGLVRKVPMKDLAPLATRLKVNFLKSLMAADTTEHLAKFIISVGSRNVLELVHFLGEKETLHLAQRLKVQKMQGLIYLIHGMKLRPIASAKKLKKPNKKKKATKKSAKKAKKKPTSRKRKN
jgi:hypothetical protein